MAGGERGGATILDNLWLPLPMLGAAVAALAGLATGGWAVTRRHERSVLAFGAVALGVFVLVFVPAEVLVRR